MLDLVRGSGGSIFAMGKYWQGMKEDGLCAGDMECCRLIGEVGFDTQVCCLLSALLDARGH